jgi:hypothetical protein
VLLTDKIVVTQKIIDTSTISDNIETAGLSVQRELTINAMQEKKKGGGEVKNLTCYTQL